MMDRGIFLWQVPTVRKGDPVKIAALLRAAGIKRLDVKVAEAAKPYKVPLWSPNPTWGLNVKRDWVRTMQNLGIKVWGYGFNYGYDPTGEGMVAASQVAELGLDGYIFNAETKFENQPSAGKRAELVVKAFRDNSPQVPAALCAWALWKSPWRGNRWHSTSYAIPFMDAMDYAMPMVYWWQGRSTIWVHETIKQWNEIFTPNKPFTLVGRAYSGEGMGTVDPEEMKDFAALLREYEVTGESWWELRIALLRNAVWDVIDHLTPLTPPPPPPVGTVSEVVGGLASWARGKGYDGPGLA